ncbi:transcription factor 7-like 1-A isoform X2 [Takifugu rubripes]|uniref:transcription factor 7-like 1-A isoform X2 n=1 Tax=Takifugu rubripes TaxID=31033 RepID=UPI001145A5DB|nr:transcription factor 7-like 1-A isoform X2 [Takifugu rubripes]
MALFAPHPLYPPTHESAPKCTTAHHEQELWDLIEQTETAVPISPVQDQSVHPDMQNAKPSFVLPDPDSASKSTQDQHGHFLGWMSGQQLFKVPEDGSDRDDNNRVYIKKPPNAFMLFMEQQRPNVSKEIWRKGSGAVNSHLAAIWRSMSKEEQSSYFSESERLTILHKVMYPNWSHQMNYGKRRQRDRSEVSSPESNFAMPDPRNPAQVIQGPHTQSNMTQPPVQHGAYIPDPAPQGPFLPYDLPQGPYMWNPNPQSSFFQNNLPQGSGMLNPHQPGPYVQNPQPQGPYMCNPNAQGPFMLNPYSQGPYMHTSHPQGPFMMNYYAQGPYMHNPHSQASNMNYPYTEGPYMNNPVPQRPLQSHYPEGIYMCNQQSLGDCMPTQQTTDGVHAKSTATGIPANTGL